jgi:glycosyltransferase involved in cell wall biosynthesis
MVGRLIPWKGLALACEALADDAASSWSLDVIGDGPDAARCQRLAERLRVANRIRFRGKLSRAETLDRIAGADALLHPAIHDSAPFVVAEAVTLGVPVVCLDRCGPPVQVSPPHDIVVPATTRRAAVQGLTRGLADVASRRHASRSPSDALVAEALPTIVEGIYRDAIAHSVSGGAGS